MGNEGWPPTAVHGVGPEKWDPEKNTEKDVRVRGVASPDVPFPERSQFEAGPETLAKTPYSFEVPKDAPEKFGKHRTILNEKDRRFYDRFLRAVPKIPEPQAAAFRDLVRYFEPVGSNFLGEAKKVSQKIGNDVNHLIGWVGESLSTITDLKQGVVVRASFLEKIGGAEVVAANAYLRNSKAGVEKDLLNILPGYISGRGDYVRGPGEPFVNQVNAETGQRVWKADEKVVDPADPEVVAALERLNTTVIPDGLMVKKVRGKDGQEHDQIVGLVEVKAWKPDEVRRLVEYLEVHPEQEELSLTINSSETGQTINRLAIDKEAEERWAQGTFPGEAISFLPAYVLRVPSDVPNGYLFRLAIEAEKRGHVNLVIQKLPASRPNIEVFAGLLSTSFPGKEEKK